MESSTREQPYHELCRLCASYDAVKMDIFGQEGKNRQLVNKIHTCLPFKIAEDDRLPKCLCYRCMYNLENFYDFRTACVNAVAILERRLVMEDASYGRLHNHIASRTSSEIPEDILKGKEIMLPSCLIPEAPVVNPNAALGTPPRLNSDGEACHEIEEILDHSGTDEAENEVDDRKSDEYEMDMETNPSDFLEMPPMVTEDNEESDGGGGGGGNRQQNQGRLDPTPIRLMDPHQQQQQQQQQQPQQNVFQRTSEQHEVYVCSLCNKAFSSKGHLSLHARIHVGAAAGDVIGEKVITDDHTSYKRPYQCDLCNKSYSTAKHRWGHVSTTHRGHPAVTCGYCSRIYSTRTNLEEHIKSRHAGLPIPQEITNNQAPQPYSQVKNRQFQCKTCPKIYTSVTELNKHSRLCLGERQQQINRIRNMNILQKSQNDQMNQMMVDTTLSDLSSIDTDDESKDYRSAEAKLAKNPQLTILKQALTKSDIKRDYDDKNRSKHKKLPRIGDGCETEVEKRWYCEMCPQSFLSVEQLKEHEISHDADKPYVCILCKKDFVLKSSLSRHILSSHGVDPSPILDSDKCMKRSVLATTAIPQLQSWNDQMEITRIKDENFTKENIDSPLSPNENPMDTNDDDEDPGRNTENMIEIETVFVCEICTRDFNDRASLWLHIRATHKEFAAFACGVCLKICSDNAQLLNHVNMYHGGSKLLVSEQRRYSCTICGRQHDSRKKLITHVSIHNVDPSYDPASFVQLNTNYYNENFNNSDVNEQQQLSQHQSLPEQLQIQPQIIDFDAEDGEKVDCYICYKSFPNEDHLIRHQRNAHKSEQMLAPLDPTNNGNGNSSNPGQINRAQYHLFFVCELCGSSHPSKWERWLHVSSAHSEEPSIKCERPDCGKIFATKSLRNDHAQHHQLQGPSPNTCEICGKLWGSRVDYWKHVMGVHSDTVPLICGVCLKVFPDVLKLSQHVRTNHWPLTNGDFSCDICGRPYSNKSKMSRHRKIHGLENLEYQHDSMKNHLEPPENQRFVCEMCQEKFTSFQDISNHRKNVHKLFPCDLCCKFYGRTSHLWKHVNRVHKGHEDVTCRFCLKTSASREHLAAHILKIHRYESQSNSISNENDYELEEAEENVTPTSHTCDRCKKSFHKRYLLRRHMKGCQNYRKDPSALLTRCRACERIFKDRLSLQKHIENHHSVYKCHLCEDTTIVSKLGIMTHNRIHHMNHPDLTCQVSSCKKLFRTLEDLENHRKDHKYMASPNVCDFCGDTVENKLKLKMHVLSLHRNEIGVSCGVCLIPMKDPKDLKKHVEDVHKSILTKVNTCRVCGKQYASKWKAYDHTKKCHGKVFKTCKQCLDVFTSDIEILKHYEKVHNVITKDRVATLKHPERNNASGTNDRKRKKETYDCEVCPEIFLTESMLSEHYKKMHSDCKRYKRKKHDKKPLENATSASFTTTAATTSSSSTSATFVCKNCNKEFSTKTLFWNHLNSCKKRNISTSSSSAASASTTMSNQFTPDFNLFEKINLNLQQQFEKSYSKNHHRKDSRKVYDESTNTECACEVCGKEWPAKKHLWQHLIRFHRSEAAVTCGVCLKLCKDYGDLSLHLKNMHEAILSCEGNNFTCKTCGRYHNARSKLLLHTSIHIGKDNDGDKKANEVASKAADNDDDNKNQEDEEDEEEEDEEEEEEDEDEVVIKEENIKMEDELNIEEDIEKESNLDEEESHFGEETSTHDSSSNIDSSEEEGVEEEEEEEEGEGEGDDEEEEEEEEEEVEDEGMSDIEDTKSGIGKREDDFDKFLSSSEGEGEEENENEEEEDDEVENERHERSMSKGSEERKGALNEKDVEKMEVGKSNHGKNEREIGNETNWNETELKEEESDVESREDDDDDDDDQPPVLSPMIPFGKEDEHKGEVDEEESSNFLARNMQEMQMEVDNMMKTENGIVGEEDDSCVEDNAEKKKKRKKGGHQKERTARSSRMRNISHDKEGSDSSSGKGNRNTLRDSKSSTEMDDEDAVESVRDRMGKSQVEEVIFGAKSDRKPRGEEEEEKKKPEVRRVNTTNSNDICPKDAQVSENNRGLEKGPEIQRRGRGRGNSEEDNERREADGSRFKAESNDKKSIAKGKIKIETQEERGRTEESEEEEAEKSKDGLETQNKLDEQQFLDEDCENESNNDEKQDYDSSDSDIEEVRVEDEAEEQLEDHEEVLLEREQEEDEEENDGVEQGGEIHTVLMLTKDSDGNEILIEQDVLGMVEEDDEENELLYQHGDNSYFNEESGERQEENGGDGDGDGNGNDDRDDDEADEESEDIPQNNHDNEIEERTNN